MADIDPWESFQGGSEGEGRDPWDSDTPSRKKKVGAKKSNMEELQDMSIPRQAMSGAVGAPEAAVSMASSIPAMAIGGAKGIKELVTGKGLKAAAEAAKQGTSDYTYEPRSTAGKVFTEGAGEAFENVKEGLAASPEVLASDPNAANIMGGPNAGIPAGNAFADILNLPKPENQHVDMPGVRSAIGAGVEFGAAAGPLAAMKPKARKVTPELSKPKPKEVDPWEMPDDLFQKDEFSEYNPTPIDQPEQMVRGNQFRQDPAEVAQRQKEYDLEQEQLAREESLRQGQPDIFQTPQEELQSRLGDGGTGMRDTIPGPDLEARGVRGSEGQFHPELTDSEYTGPRQQGELFDNSVDFKKYDPERVADQVAAKEIPGFMRSAEEVMRARELERAENPQIQRDRSNSPENGGFANSEFDPIENLRSRLDRIESITRKMNDSGDTVTGPLFDAGGSVRKQLNYIEEQLRNLETGLKEGWVKPEHEAPARKQFDRALKRIEATISEQENKKVEARLPDNTIHEFMDPMLAAVMRVSARNAGERLGTEYVNPKHSNPVRIGLTHISRKSRAPFYRELAKKLLDDPEFKPDYSIVGGFDTPSVAGRYYSQFHTVSIKRGLEGSEQLFLHETVHAHTFSAIEAFKRQRSIGSKVFNKNFKHLEVPVKRIFDLYDSLKDELNWWIISKVVREGASPENPFLHGDEVLSPQNRARNSYGITDVHEFVAEGFTNPAFQAQLAQIKVPRELSNKGMFKYYWDAFVGSVSELMGLKGRGNTYLSELLRAGSDLMSGMGKKERIYYADMIDEHKTLGARIQDLGPVGAAQELAREFRLDKFEKLEEEIIPELTAKNAKIEDFTAKDSNLLWQATLRLGSLVKKNLLQDTTLAQLMKDKPGTGKVVRWTVDQVSRIEREGLIKTKEALDIALKPFRKMYHDKSIRPDLQEAWKTWQQNIGVRDLTRADFRTDKQWDMYKNFQGVFDKILDELNDKRVAAGFKPIDRIQSYFHAAWEGDYRVFAHDGGGNKVWAQGFKTEWEAKKWAKAYREKHPELRIDDPAHVVRDKYGLNDLSAFEDAIRVMSDKDNEITRALQETYREILQKRGFGRTAVHRKGVMGFMGMEEGSLGLRMMERSFDQYVNQAYRYMGNLEKQKVLAELQKVPTEIRKEKLPETFDFLYSYIRKTQGGKLGEVAIDSFIEQISQAVGFGAGAPMRFIRGGAQIASLYWLTTPRFLVSQTVQSINAIPKLIQQFGTVDGTKAFFDGWMSTLKPDALTKEGAEWASKKGYLDPTIKNMIHGDRYEVPIGDKHPLLNLQAYKEVASYPAAMVEHHLVRLPTFIMFEKALRPFIKDKEKRFQEAAEKTDYYMVNYARAHSPLVYDKLGMAGELARPLKQYAHNTWGQFIEYSKGLKDKGEVAPLAAFFGTQAAVAGLKGVILVSEATVIVNLLNNMFDMDIPTPEQLMLKSGLHDALVYGGLSSALGFDVSASVSAPSLPQMFTFPAIQFATKAFLDVGNFAVKLSKGEDTDYDRLRAAMALSPNLMHEWLRSIYTKPGEPTVNPNDKQLRGNYRRSQGIFSENSAAILFSAKPLNEAKADALMRSVKKELQRDIQQRMNALDAMSDRVMNGKEVTPELLQRYMEEGGDIRRLPSNLINRMKERMMTGPERLQDSKSMTAPQIHKLEIEQKYLDRITNDLPNKAMGYDEEGNLKPIGAAFVGDERIGESRMFREGKHFENAEVPKNKDDNMVKAPFKKETYKPSFRNKNIDPNEFMRDQQRKHTYRM